MSHYTARFGFVRGGGVHVHEGQVLELDEKEARLRMQQEYVRPSTQEEIEAHARAQGIAPARGEPPLEEEQQPEQLEEEQLEEQPEQEEEPEAGSDESIDRDPEAQDRDPRPRGRSRGRTS